MKRLIFTVMVVGLLTACGGGSTDTMRRLQQAEDVVEEHPDSAAGLLSQVVTTGMTEEETALYGLLWTMAEFKKHNKDVNDSLVSRSIEYYDRHGDKWHRASAYYYRGGVKRHMMKNVPEAIKDYKTAEGLAEGSGRLAVEEQDRRAVGVYQLLQPECRAGSEIFAEVLEGCQDAERLDNGGKSALDGGREL